MTCRIVATVTYNYPITITKEIKDGPTEVLFKSEGEPQTFIGEHSYSLDSWFTGSQVIKVTETPKPE